MQKLILFHLTALAVILVVLIVVGLPWWATAIIASSYAIAAVASTAYQARARTRS